MGESVSPALLNPPERRKNRLRARRQVIRKSGKTGYTISLTDNGYQAARYTREAGTIRLEEVRASGAGELSSSVLRGKHVSACFPPRSAYADVGEFSSVSADATLAHIRSTIDKTGLFNEDYCVSYAKISDIDAVRARYSYLAIPATDVDRISVLNGSDILLDAYCPIEASIAAVAGKTTKETCVVMFEDDQSVRIIGTKAGIIYHLITIQKSSSFDLLAETLAGISEMTSLLRVSYNETPRTVFTAGRGEMSIEDLRENDIDAAGLLPEDLPGHGNCAPELLGNVSGSAYDFTPGPYPRARTLARYAGYSLLLSLVMITCASLIFFLGLRCSWESRDLEKRTEAALQAYTHDMTLMEHDCSALLKYMEPDRINGLIALYQRFESEPRLHAMLGAITGAVPAQTSIERVEVVRPGARTESDDPYGSLDLPEPSAMPSPGSAVFQVKIEGVIRAQYPLSKSLFSTFLSGLQEHYPVAGATFRHTDQWAGYTVECEVKR